MELQEFIDQNRTELTECINRVTGYVPKTVICRCPKSGTEHYHAQDPIDDEEIEQWILNDEGLYNWAREEGVEI